MSEPTTSTTTATSTLKPGWKTTEFWLSLLAVVLGALLTSGLLADGSQAIRIVGLGATVLGALGYTGARAMLKKAPMLAVFLLGAAVIPSASGCTKGAAIAAGKSVVDCTKGAAPELVTEFSPVLEQLISRATGGDGHVDKASVLAGVKNFGVDVGGCVLATVVARALAPAPADPNAPKSSPLIADAADLRSIFDSIRTTRLGGATFRTDAGPL